MEILLKRIIKKNLYRSFSHVTDCVAEGYEQITDVWVVIRVSPEAVELEIAAYFRFENSNPPKHCTYHIHSR